MKSINDVARFAGVGVGTVSRVINKNPSVKPDTRKKVLSAIEQLQYVPNEVARNFKLMTSNMVALLLPTIRHPFFSELAYYIEDELDLNDYKLILCNSRGKPKKELNYFDILNRNKVAGIIAITYNDIDHKVMKEIPIVSIDRHLKEEISYVTSDNYAGGRIAFNELIKAGARNPAYMGYLTKSKLKSEVELRKRGFIDEAVRQKIPYNCHEILDDEHSDIGFSEFFCSESYKSVDGLFISNDFLAAEYIERAISYKIRVPEDVKVIGYDGIQSNNCFHPYLSTIRQPVEQMARISVQLLIRKIKDKNIEKEIHRLPVEFRKGETT